MKKYDIGILTLWNVPNYGTYVQAYALQKVIEKLSCRETVQIAHLDSHHYHFYYDYKQYLRDSGLFSKGFLKSFFVRATSDNTRLTSFGTAYDRIPHTETIMKDNIHAYSFNKVFLGSDILWDYGMEPFNRDPMLFGNGIQGQINSYAASFGTVRPGDRHPRYVVDGLRNMRHISVRDKKSAKIVEEILGYTPPVVLDPTWLWDFTSDRNVVDPQDENYILVYGQDFTESFIENLIRFAKSEHKRIVALDCNQDRYNWCDKLIRQSELSPFEWIGYFKNADYIATSTYHGLTFSLIFQKKFAFCKTDFILAKVDAFLDELNILPYFEDREDVQYMLTRDWDYLYINKIIDEKRRQSFHFLEAAIGE